jgi:hypothetical protein
MTKFALTTKYSKCPDAEIVPGRYPNGSTGWDVYGDCGEGFPEAIGTPTVALGQLPPEDCVFIKVTDDYKGWLESLVRAHIVEDTGKRVGAGYVAEYAAVCRVKVPGLIWNSLNLTGTPDDPSGLMGCLYRRITE